MGIKSADQITIIDVTDAYSVMLTSEAYTFIGDTSGVPVGQTCSTEVVAFCGTSQCNSVNVTAGDIVCPTGITAKVENSGTTKVKITFTTAAVISTACEATIPIVVDSITVNKKFSFAVAKAGVDGQPGKDGTNGKTSYFHIKYSPVENPTPSQMSEIPNTYIGTYVDYTAPDSTDPSKYTWYRFKGLQGKQGTQGIPGTKGADGKTSYLHIKYSNDGGKTFTSNSGETVGDYIGQCTDFNKDDPTTVETYTWSRIKGEDGTDGQMLYATCDTASGTVAKVASLAAGTLSLKAGATVAVKFTYANTASSPTLNIAGTGTKAMYIQGVRDVYWTDGATVTFTYDGTNWRVASEPVYAPTATIGNAAGFNVYVDGTSVQVRRGSEELAIFKGDEIRLGEGVDCAKVFICNLEIGVYETETYLRNSSTRISTKPSHEAGSASVPYLVVDDKDTWINGRGMSSLVNFFPGNVHRMTAGTKVLTAGKTGTSRQLFSNSEINSLLGVSNSSNGNTAVMVSNGDGAATGVHVEGCTYQNGAWHAVFNTNIGSVPIRINYIITYWG